MSQYNWKSCPTPVRTQVQKFRQHISTILSDNLVGVYLHGSLAMGCFNPERSDIDLFVVVQQPMSVEIKRQIIDHLLHLSNAPCPIETSFVILSGLHPFEHPLLYDLHYSETWRQQNEREMRDGTWQHWNAERRRDPDLTAHLMIIRHRGIALCGKPVQEVFPVVPAKDYTHSILGDYREAREGRMSNPIYFVLNACRVAAYLSEGHVYSKDEGGIYGLEAFPAEFHALINQALQLYRGLSPAISLDERMLDGFAAFLDQQFQRDAD
ncbi:MAG TPA: aminoglycoside adenylyltransferase domain-containing protein [Ktedonobacteraceae bacterium]|nr:aminoglycoside adenylyltransferase domain-containing protein [Ktedonobacteraceae bacterium]